MPIYSYHCKDCQNKFDLLIGVTADQTELKCDKCGSASIEKTMGSFSVRMGLSTIPSGSGGSCSSGGCCPTC
ncbi:FmdB family zinc ribbon protein [Acidobacteriota bacterium]